MLSMFNCDVGNCNWPVSTNSVFEPKQLVYRAISYAEMFPVSVPLSYRHLRFGVSRIYKQEMDEPILKLHSNHVNRHFPWGPEIPDFFLSAVLLLSADCVEPQLVMWDTCTCELLYIPAGFSSDHSVNAHVHVGDLTLMILIILNCII